jgi:uncharacterized protein YebE (UPF0316 family)
MDLILDPTWLLAVLIFVARVADVSMGTLRTILVIRGHSLAAMGIGFVETLIWITASAQVIANLGEAWYLAGAYAGGFAMGTYVGILIENKLAIGSELVRAVSLDPSVNLAARLRGAGYDVVEIQAEKEDSIPVEVLLIVERRRRVPRLLRTIDENDPSAYYTVSDVKRQRVFAKPRRTMHRSDLFSFVKRK